MIEQVLFWSIWFYTAWLIECVYVGMRVLTTLHLNQRMFSIIMDDISTLHLKAACRAVWYFIFFFFVWRLLYQDAILLPNDSIVPHAVVCHGSWGRLEPNGCSCHLPAAVSTLQLSIWRMWWNSDGIDQNHLVTVNRKKNHIHYRLPFWERNKFS